MSNSMKEKCKQPKHTFRVGWIKGYETFNDATGKVEVILIDERDNTLVEINVTLEALSRVLDFLESNRTLGKLKDLHKSINSR